MLTYDAICKKFLDFFKKHDHTAVPSASLIPTDDPSLLFVNAGMVPFKRLFLGLEKPESTKLTSAQRCLRVGGKHNDLDQVGFTTRHHTLFTMLGNFSIGDYFKLKAIQLAWQFITEELMLAVDKLYVTVHESDDEAYNIWLNDIGVAADRIIRCGDKDNFWMMGDVGPCGPCSEIFYDLGPSCNGGLPGTETQDGDRYMEIWNLVFMQYERKTDGEMVPLPKPSVDTGMGLERITAVLQGVTDTFDIDIYSDMMAVLNQRALVTLPRYAQKIIVDHLRASFFMILDHVVPSNEGRGYVLRRVLRRALRYAYQAGMSLPGIFKIVPELCEILHASDHRLVDKQQFIAMHIRREEEQFIKTLEQGMQVLDQKVIKSKASCIDAKLVFKLYDTYGFPFDVTRDVAREHGIDIDEGGFYALMEKQRQQSKKTSKFKSVDAAWSKYASKTEFLGYDHTHADAEVVAIVKISENGVSETCDKISDSDQAMVILNQTPCYPESGGQVGDKAIILTANAEFVVSDTQKEEGVIAHLGYVRKGCLSNGDKVSVTVGDERRKIALNHSATHLLHFALREVLGRHVVQKGSLVAPDRLRFDFTHHKPLSRTELNQVEARVNDMIRQNSITEITWLPLKEAIESGAMALFGEKYSDPVRVVKLGKESVELCGGIHVRATGDIGAFKVTVETGVAAGIRRIEAISGQMVIDWWQDQEALIRSVEVQVKQQLKLIPKKLQQLSDQVKSLKKTSIESSQLKDNLNALLCVEGTAVGYYEAMTKDDMMKLADMFVNKDNRVVLILTGKPGAYQYVMASHKNVKFSAKSAQTKLMAELVISGGGRPERVQGVIKEFVTEDRIAGYIKELLDK